MSSETTPDTQRSPRSLAALAAFLLLAFGAAALGALFPPGDWYQELAKPPWTPPGWLFGPVWTVLYAMIGVAGWLLWSERDRSTRPLIWWAIQLALNAAWSWLFFGLWAPGAALVDITLMLVAIAATIWTARATSRTAAWLLVPYLGWVAFATALNAAIWRLN